MKLGDRISKKRKEKGITQEQLADIMNVSRQSVSLWENNQTIPTMDKLMQLSDVLGVSVSTLVGNELEYDENVLPLARAKTLLNINIIDEMLKMYLKKMRTSTIVQAVLFGFVGLISYIVDDSANLFFLVVFIVVEPILISRLFLTRKKLRDSALRDLQRDPNKEYLFDFYNDYVNISIKSQMTDSKIRISFKDLNKVVETEHFYFLVDNGKYIPVEKSSLQGNVDTLRSLLRGNASTYESPFEKIDNRANGMSFKELDTLKLISTVLFVLTFFTIPLGMIVVSVYSQFVNVYSSMSFIENIWIMIIVFPLPLASIITGLVLRKNSLKGTKNIVVGAIMGGLLIIYSSFTLIFGKLISHDYAYVDNLEVTIGFELPDHGHITTQKYTDESGLTDIFTESKSDVLFIDAKEVEEFESRLYGSNLWTNVVSTKNIGMLPLEATFDISSYDKFMIFNVNQSTYNELPTTSGTYQMLFLAYDSINDKMNIFEFKLSLIVD